MTTPSAYLSKAELADIDPTDNKPKLVVPGESVVAEAPNRGHNAIANSVDFLAKIHRAQQSMVITSSPDLTWNNATKQLTITGNLELSYTIDDPSMLVAVSRKTTLSSGSYDFGVGTIMMIPFGIDNDVTISPSGAASPASAGSVIYAADDAQLQSLIQAEVDAEGRERAYRFFVFARVVGTSLQLFNRIILRNGILVEDAVRDTEYGGDAAFQALSRRVNQDRGTIITGGGVITWLVDGLTGNGAVSASTQLQLRLPRGIVISTTNAVSGVTLTPINHLLAINLSRTDSMSTTASMFATSPAAVLASNDNILVLAYWDAATDNLHWFEGTVYCDGDVFPIGQPNKPDPEEFLLDQVPFFVFPDGFTADAALPPGDARVAYVAKSHAGPLGASTRLWRAVDRFSLDKSIGVFASPDVASESFEAQTFVGNFLQALSGDTITVYDEFGIPGGLSALFAQLTEIHTDTTGGGVVDVLDAAAVADPAVLFRSPRLEATVDVTAPLVTATTEVASPLVDADLIETDEIQSATDAQLDIRELGGGDAASVNVAYAEVDAIRNRVGVSVNAIDVENQAGTSRVQINVRSLFAETHGLFGTYVECVELRNTNTTVVGDIDTDPLEVNGNGGSPAGGIQALQFDIADSAGTRTARLVAPTSDRVELRDSSNALADSELALAYLDGEEIRLENSVRLNYGSTNNAVRIDDGAFGSGASLPLNVECGDLYLLGETLLDPRIVKSGFATPVRFIDDGGADVSTVALNHPKAQAFVRWTGASYAITGSQSFGFALGTGPGAGLLDPNPSPGIINLVLTGLLAPHGKVPDDLMFKVTPRTAIATTTGVVPADNAGGTAPDNGMYVSVYLTDVSGAPAGLDAGFYIAAYWED